MSVTGALKTQSYYYIQLSYCEITVASEPRSGLHKKDSVETIDLLQRNTLNFKTLINNTCINWL